MKPIYFLSDAHLGSLALLHTRQRERRLVRFLDEIKEKAGAVYLLGDMFDFWFEYRAAVPKGYTRFLGKLSELTDRGVEVHFFTGNHDIWCKDYLTTECGVIVHYQPVTLSLADKTFFIGHGDGLRDNSRGFRFIRAVFHNRFCQWLFRWIHPDLGIAFGLRWARQGRLSHATSQSNGMVGEPPYMGEDKEPLVLFAKDYLRSHPDVNYFLFGHRHIELDLMLSHQCRMVILGDWISQFTYAVFDGEHFYMENYIEGETEV